MEKSSVFTFFKKYKIGFLLLLIVFLGGCSGAINEPVDASSAGWFDHYFVYTFSRLIKGIAAIFNDNYGLSIILITLIIRLALMPFLLKQTKSSMQMREKMNVIKPEIEALQKKYEKKTDAASKAEMQQETMKIYQKHNMNPLASLGGCLPMLIQFPILIAFYYAIRRTPEIATHSFLWFNLGQTDIIMTIIAVVVYYLQFKVSQRTMDPQMRKQMAIMGLLSPVMIGFISLNAPAALPLYWAVGGIFMIIQTLIAQKLYAVNDTSVKS